MNDLSVYLEHKLRLYLLGISIESFDLHGSWVNRRIGDFVTYTELTLGMAWLSGRGDWIRARPCGADSYMLERSTTENFSYITDSWPYTVKWR